MLTHPQFDPVALSLGPLSIHWYGLMYIVAFAGIWRLGLYRAHRNPGAWTDEQISDLVFYGAMGAVIGGRLGSVFFYNFDRFLADPMAFPSVGGRHGVSWRFVGRARSLCLVLAQIRQTLFRDDGLRSAASALRARRWQAG